MTKVFIDTNVFVRFLTQDDPKKFQECKKFFEFIEKGKIRPYTSNIVILEIQFVLTRQYNVAKKEVLENIDDLLSLRHITLIEKTNTRIALSLYKKYNIKFTDCLIATQIPRGSKLVTYDEEFKKIKGISVSSPEELIS